MTTELNKSPKIPLGNVIAERRLTMLERSGEARPIMIQIGAPVPVNMDGSISQADALEDAFRCPLSIIGIGMDNRVLAPFGADSLIALHYAIGLAGKVLDEAVQRLSLTNPRDQIAHARLNPNEADATSFTSWLWRYRSSQTLPTQRG